MRMTKWERKYHKIKKLYCKMAARQLRDVFAAEKIEETVYKVHSFVDNAGNPVASIKKASLALAYGVKGYMKGTTTPLALSIVRKLRLKVGDEFTEHIRYSRP